MVGDRQADTAVLAAHRHLGRAGRIARRGIVVRINNIADAGVAAAAGLIDQARGIR